MTCLKACPHRSVELNLRPPGIELWTTHRVRSPEVALLFLLCGGVLLHRLPEILAAWDVSASRYLENFWTHSLLSLATLLVPLAIASLGYAVMHVTRGRYKLKSFATLAYGFLPLVFGGNLSHYLDLGLLEAGQVLTVTAKTFGVYRYKLPELVAHPAVVDFLQGTTLIVSGILSVLLIQKIARQPVRVMLPQHAAAMALIASFWAVLV